MPGTVTFKDASWVCPECEAVNEIGYVQCEECDIEFEAVNARQNTKESPGKASNSASNQLLNLYGKYRADNPGLSSEEAVALDNFVNFVQQQLA